MEGVSPRSFRHSVTTQFQGRLADKISIDPDQVEVFSLSDSPLYPNPPMWEPVDSAGITPIAVFYLANQLFEEQMQSLKTELQTYDNKDEEQVHNKACCFVPWGEENTKIRDGTVDDMWEVFWGMYQMTTFEMPVFFINSNK